MQLKPGYIRKKISGDWGLLRCGCGGRWQRSAGETLKQMKRCYRWYRKKECDLEKEEELDRSYAQKRTPVEVGYRGSDDRKKTEGKETIGYAK